MKISESMRSSSQQLMYFLDNAPTAAYAVHRLIDKCQRLGFKALKENNRWLLKPGDKFFVKRNDTALSAGIIGKKNPLDTGYKVIGAHTDSPGFRVKHNCVYQREGYVQLGIEIYGGPLLSTWTDRDLSLAGRLVLDEGQEVPTSVLWKSEHPLIRISQLPIHMNRKVNDEGLILDKQKHLPPVLALSNEKPFTLNDLKGYIADDLNVAAEQIKGVDLELYDLQKANLAGLNQEFLISGRIDNLAMCYAAIEALINREEHPETTLIVTLFNNEEIGSSTRTGGGSPFLENTLERVALTQGLSREEFLATLAKSLLLSADGAHAVHPNYTDEYEPHHKVYLNKGPVIKLNAMQKYASAPATTAYFEKLCQAANVPVQHYIHRTDKPCGSTIGPITATRTGIKTMDVGHAMLSMHSIREMMGSADIFYMIRAMKQFLQ